MRSFLPLCVAFALIHTGCTSEKTADSSRKPAGPTASNGAETIRPAAFVEGKDYTLVERRRLLDEQGFDRPVEAFSILFPKGWNVQGGVVWRGVQGCRGDIVSNQINATSPDGALRYEVRPSRTFVWSNNSMLMQSMQAGAQQGGCQLNQPFDASQYIEGFAKRDLQATASNIRVDESRLAGMQQIDAQANSIARQYGNDSEQKTTIALGDIQWPDGRHGILHVGVTSIVSRKPDLLGGAATIMSTTSVFHCVLMSFPADRKDEATKLFELFQTSYRQNPTWKQAKDRFLTNLGNMEHAGNMERIRLMGEQSRAYAKAQQEASEQRIRDWENRQSSQEQQHKQFIQTIREVETWKDSSGTVELSSGYNQAWSRGDGSYILSNAPGFDPGSVLQDQRWQEMQRTKP